MKGGLCHYIPLTYYITKGGFIKGEGIADSYNQGKKLIPTKYIWFITTHISKE